MKTKPNVTDKQIQLSLDLQRQRDFIKDLQDKKFEYGLVLANAFVKGMRDIGYKSTAFALDELIDNAIQAGARNIHVAFGFGSGNASEKKPEMLAIIDDGHGMDPMMVRASVIWGGTHRHNDRTGFGRYGYGLPSACVSIGRRYTVLSKVEGSEWNSVHVDLDEIEEHCQNGQGPVCVNDSQPARLPTWVAAYIAKHLPSMTAGTVVLIEKVDRLDYKTTRALSDFLLQEFGITYRNFVSEVTIAVNGTVVEPTDPLFLTPGLRFYDIDEDRATALPPLEIEVKDKETKEPLGVIKVRFSLMPPTFLRVSEDKFKPKGGKSNARCRVRKENNGIIVLRAGRQIAVISAKCPWTTFQNNDRYLGIEVDFPPTLDEEFSVTPLMQSVAPRPRIWDIMEENGVFDAIMEMRRKAHKEAIEMMTKREGDNEKRPSEIAVENAVKMFSKAPSEANPTQRHEGEIRLNREAEKVALQLSLPFDEAKTILVARAKAHPFKVAIEDSPGAPFYRVEQVGQQTALHINKAHRFFRVLYAAPGSTPTSRHALEALLFVLGLIELQAKPELAQMLAATRAQWSDNAEKTLGKLHDDDKVRDDLALLEEIASGHTAQSRGDISLETRQAVVTH